MRETKAEFWARLIAEQEAGGQSVRAFCRRHSVGEHCFYWWRRRLRDSQSERFVRVETRHAVGSGLEPALELELALELVLNNGERLRIVRGADAATLRLALDAIRA